MDTSHVYVGAWALTALVDSCAEIKSACPFSGIAKSGRVWEKVPESDTQSVALTLGVFLILW